MKIHVLLGITFISAAIFAADVNAQVSACPSSNFEVLNDQILAVGSGESKKIAYKNALDDLGSQTGSAIVESQFIQSSDMYTTESRSYESARAIGTIDGHKLQQQIQLCEDGSYIAYLLYDERALLVRIVSVLGKQTFRFIGDAYITQSPLLERFHQETAEDLIYASLSYHHDHYQLALNESAIKLSQAEMRDAFLLPALANAVNSQITQTGAISGGSAIANTIKLSVRAKPNTNVPSSFQLYYCSLNNTCSLLSHTLLPNSSLYLGSPYLSPSLSSSLLVAVPQTNNTVSITESLRMPSLLDLLTVTGSDTYIAIHALDSIP